MKIYIVTTEGSDGFAQDSYMQPHLDRNAAIQDFRAKAKEIRRNNSDLDVQEFTKDSYLEMYNDGEKSSGYATVSLTEYDVDEIPCTELAETATKEKTKGENRERIWLINIPGPHGYSFAVRTDEDDEQCVIDRARKAEMFDDTVDADYAFAEDITDDPDQIEAFKEYTYGFPESE